MDQIAFFWVGKNITVPSILVESINLIYKSDVKIYHLTDMITPPVPGVTEVYRQNLSSDVMLARLEAYKSLSVSNNDLICFCDADSLFFNRLHLNQLKKDIYLVKRTKQHDGMMNANFNEYYPEFENKQVSEVMPYFFGNLIIRHNESFFDELYKICLGLPDRFHRWFGDQYSLKIQTDKTQSKFELLENERYLYIADKILSQGNIINLISNDTKFVTFKGFESKQFLKQTYFNLLNVKHNEHNFVDFKNSDGIPNSVKNEAEELYKLILKNLSA